MRDTEPMTNKRFTITIDLHPESAHEAEDIFDAVQLLLADEFGGEAEASFGSPNEIIDADQALIEIGKSLKRIEGISEEIPYAIRVAFTADRVLTDHELASLENAVAVQVEDPHVPDADGEMDRAEFTVRNVVVGVER